MTFVRPDIPSLPSYGPKSNTLSCRYCRKQYQRPSILRKHEHQLHGHPDPLYVEAASVEENSTKDDSVDFVLNYTSLCFTIGLFGKKQQHNDAIKMGHGDRIMRLNK